MIPRKSIDQLGCYSYIVSIPSNTPLENISYTQFLTNLLNFYGLALVCEGRVTSNHKELWNLAERSDDLLSEPVAKVLLFGIPAHVCERQHGDGGLIGEWKCHLLFGCHLHGWLNKMRI